MSRNPRRPTELSPKVRLAVMARRMQVLIALGAVGLLFGAISSFTSDRLLDPHTRELLRMEGLSEPVLSVDMRAGLIAIALPGVLLGFYALWQVWRLFSAYGLGQVFGPIAVGRIRALAWALVATSLLHAFSSTFDILLLTWHNPPGQRQLVIGLAWEDYFGALVGGLLLAMAWAMTEAGRLEQDNASFV